MFYILISFSVLNVLTLNSKKTGKDTIYYLYYHVFNSCQIAILVNNNKIEKPTFSNYEEIGLWHIEIISNYFLGITSKIGVPIQPLGI